MKILLLSFLIFIGSQSVFADCVFSEKEKSTCIVLDNHTILLKELSASNNIYVTI